MMLRCLAYHHGASVDFNETATAQNEHEMRKVRQQIFFNRFLKLGVFIIFDCWHAPEKDSQRIPAPIVVQQIDSACANSFFASPFPCIFCASPLSSKCFVYCLMTHFWNGPVTIGPFVPALEPLEPPPLPFLQSPARRRQLKSWCEKPNKHAAIFGP